MFPKLLYFIHLPRVSDALVSRGIGDREPVRIGESLESRTFAYRKLAPQVLRFARSY